MEKDIALGSIGAVKIVLGAGKATISLAAHEAVLNGGASVEAQVSAVLDSGALIDLLFAEIEAKSPAGTAPIEEMVKQVIKNAVAAIQ